MLIIKPGDSFDGVDFKQGAVFLVDKPKDWTSFDVVNKIRYRFKKGLGIKKFKVGHAGTLDPLATGLLIICVGKATKQINEFMGMSKTYTGTITLGSTRPSHDLETEIDAHYPTNHITQGLVEETRTQFLGNIEQIPPMFSAIKKDGKPLYKDARKGTFVELDPRAVTIHTFEITGKDTTNLDFEVTSSKGTYIRSLAYDFGKAMDSGSHLSLLRRTIIGEWDSSQKGYTRKYSIDEAFSVEDLSRKLEIHFGIDFEY